MKLTFVRQISETFHHIYSGFMQLDGFSKLGFFIIVNALLQNNEIYVTLTLVANGILGLGI